MAGGLYRRFRRVWTGEYVKSESRVVKSGFRPRSDLLSLTFRLEQARAEAAAILSRYTRLKAAILLYLGESERAGVESIHLSKLRRDLTSL